MSLREVTLDDCLKWKLEPLRNPHTGKKISESGPIFFVLKAICKKKLPQSAPNDKPMSDKKAVDNAKKGQAEDDDCIKWKLNPLVNPQTGKRIAEDGPIYNKYKYKLCKENKSIIDEKDCIKWNLEPLRHPHTGKKISEGGPIYNILKKICIKKLHLNETNDKPMSDKKAKDNAKKGPTEDDDCIKWKLNPLVNPRTGRRIKEDGPIYTKYQKLCKEKSQKAKIS